MNKTHFRNLLSALVVLLAFSGISRADLASDSRQSAEWFSQEMGDLMAFQAASTHFLPGNTVGFPGVTVGIAGGASGMKLDVDGYRSLSFTDLDNRSGQVDLPTTIAAPAGVLFAKVGLPGGWDLGLKGGSASFDETSADARTEFSNKIFGIEVRKRILGGGLTGAALPDLSVSVALDSASGDVTRRERYNGAVTGGSLTADTEWRSEWDVSALTVRAVISKKVLILTPFAGLGITKLGGDTETTSTIDVITSNTGLVDTVQKGKADSDETLTHAILGLELSPLPFFRINLGGLVAREHFSVSLGLRVQFP